MEASSGKANSGPKANCGKANSNNQRPKARIMHSP
jgi:hypothetical protein